MLDLWENDAQATAAPQPGEATDVPASFGEKFAGEWAYSKAVSGAFADANARNSALSSFIDQIKQAGGGDAFDAAYAAHPGSFDTMLTTSDTLDVANGVVAQLRQKSPSLELQPLTDDELNRRALSLQQGAQATYGDLQARGSTFGGKLGGFLGSVSASAAEPQNIAALAIPIGGELGYLRAALAGAGLFAGSQAVSEAANPNRAQVIPGYSPAGAVGEAAIEGAALGAGGEAVARGLGALWTRFKTGAWPTSVRDAGNLVESEANIQATNILPGADGEAAHRDALAQSVDQILNGKPVDVDIARASQALMARLQSERPFAVPIVDMGAIARTSEEAALRDRRAALADQLASLAPGDQGAAETLARVRQVEGDMAQAPSFEARRALSNRRDELRADTPPEQLPAAAAPLEQRRALTAEQSSIDDRLAEIAAERAKLTPPTGEGAQPFNLGQTSGVAPTLFDIHTGRIDNLMAMRAGGPDMRPALEDGVKALGELTGHTMPPEDAKAIAGRVAAAASDDEARAILNETVARPRTIRETLPSEPAPMTAPMTAVPARSFAESVEPDKTLADPRSDVAMQAEAERQLARLTTEKKGNTLIPVGVDDKGEPIYRSLANMLSEAKADRDAAARLEACMTPMSEAAE
ncbi:MAG: hypothetical protein ABSF67_00055 [Roseiarcus sp.]